MIKLWVCHHKDGEVRAMFQLYHEASAYVETSFNGDGGDILTIKRVDLSELIAGRDVCYVRVIN